MRCMYTRLNLYLRYTYSVHVVQGIQGPDSQKNLTTNLGKTWDKVWLRKILR